MRDGGDDEDDVGGNGDDGDVGDENDTGRVKAENVPSTSRRRDAALQSIRFTPSFMCASRGAAHRQQSEQDERNTRGNMRDNGERNGAEGRSARSQSCGERKRSEEKERARSLVNFGLEVHGLVKVARFLMALVIAGMGNVQFVVAIAQTDIRYNPITLFNGTFNFSSAVSKRKKN